MTKTYFTEEGVQVSGEGLDHLRPADDAPLACSGQTMNDRFAEMQAEIERLGRELNLAKYGEPDFSWSIHKEAMTDLLDRAEKAEAEIKRLREALERIEAASKFWSEYPDGNDAIRYAHESTHRIARAALSSTGEKG